GQVAAAQQLGDLLGIDLVVLRLATVDGFHVECVPEDKGDVLGLAQVGEPVPAKQALAGHDQAVAEGRDGLQESRRLGRHFLVQDDLAGVIEDAQVHCPGVQIDAAVESVRLVVEAHSWSPLAWVREPEPASWLEGYTLPENPTSGPKLHGFEPV